MKTTSGRRQGRSCNTLHRPRRPCINAAADALRPLGFASRPCRPPADDLLIPSSAASASGQLANLGRLLLAPHKHFRSNGLVLCRELDLQAGPSARAPAGAGPSFLSRLCSAATNDATGYPSDRPRHCNHRLFPSS